MTIRNVEHLFAPRSVALIGASREPGTVGFTVASNLLAGAAADHVQFVNPRTSELLGRPCYASVAALPRVPELAVIATPPASVPLLISELGARGTRAAVVITAGVRGELERQMLEAARPYCLRILGPNGIGLMVPGAGLNASFAHRAPLAGDLAFLSQSGALVTAIIDWAAGRRIGFSHVVSMGEMADIDFGDLLDYLAGDVHSRAILLYMEAATHARKFLSAARRAARAKPVIVVRSGRHAAGARAAASHTGALAGADAAYDAAFRRSGLLRVTELEDLFEAAEMLARVPKLAGERLAILTNGGGAGVLATDRLVDFDGQVASLAPETVSALDRALPPTWSKANPVDIIGDAGPERYAHALEILLADPRSDAVLVINCPTALASSTAVAETVVSTLKRRQAASAGAVKPVLANWLGEDSERDARSLFAASGISAFDTPEGAVHGFMQLVRYTRAQEALMRAPAAMAGGIVPEREAPRRLIETVLGAGRTLLTEPEARALIAAYGIPTAESVVAGDPAAVRRAAEAILARYRKCVLKILSEDISHKSEVDGVRLHLASPGEAEAAASEMLARVARLRPEARIQGFTVAPMIERPRAHELIIGMTVDPTFGPMLLFGAGGTAVEVMKDTSLALPPLDLELAREVMRQTRVYRLLEGYRNRPAADLAAIAETLVRTSALVAHHPEIRELDINPLLADETGVIALDARVRVADEARDPRPAMAIRAYPCEWERRSELEGFGRILVRPIRPEDEALYETFMGRLDPEDVRLRLFTARRTLSHKFLARLTQIDYAREMAFVALSESSGELLGVVRLIADPDYTRAEYAVIVRSDLKGRGLGWQLMRHLIEYAKGEGLQELFGDVLAENATMLRMCRELGFRVSAPDDPTLRRVTLDLAASAPSASLDAGQRGEHRKRRNSES